MNLFCRTYLYSQPLKREPVVLCRAKWKAISMESAVSFAPCAPSLVPWHTHIIMIHQLCQQCTRHRPPSTIRGALFSWIIKEHVFQIFSGGWLTPPPPPPPPRPMPPPPRLWPKSSRFFSNKAPPFSEKISSWPKDAKNTPFWPKYQKNPETNRFFSDRGDPEFTTPPPPLGQKFWIKLSFSVKLNSSE